MSGRVAVFAPRWGVRSEVWLDRQLTMLDDLLVCLFAARSEQSCYCGKPVVEVFPEVSAWQRLTGGALARLRHGGRNRAARILREAIATHQIDGLVIHYLDLAVEVLRLMPDLDLPLLVHCHGRDVTWQGRQHEPPHGPMHGTEYVRGVRSLAGRATIIANSQATWRKLREIGVPDASIRLKYLGVDLEAAAPVACNQTVGYLGRLVDFKGPCEVIEAFAAVASEGWRLDVAGDGPLAARCRQVREAQPCAAGITMLGGVDAATAVALRQRWALFAAHNRTGTISGQEEALGVSVLEAMAAGLPVVTGRNGGVCETVRDGVEGFLVEPGDVRAQGLMMRRLMDDASLRESMGARGQERVAGAFSLKRERESFRDLVADLF